MSRSHQHVLAILPLFALLSVSPMELEKATPSRSIASEISVAHPKYEARASKIDRTQIEIDKDLDLTCFSERGESLRDRLMSERKEYKVDLVDKDGVAVQRARVDGLVSSLVSLEEDFKALKEKKAFEEEGEKIAQNTINELKTTLESLLIDEMENELNVLKAENSKEDTPVVAEDESKEEPKEEPKKDEPAIASTDDKLCELEEKNKALSKQVEELLEQQKSILQTMLGMNQMMVQMNQQMNQQTIPNWLMNGPMMSPQFQYPSTHGTTIIMVGGQSQPQQSFIGQNAFNQAPMGNYQFPQAPQSYLQQNPYMEYDLRYMAPQPVLPGTFGNAPFMYNFGPNQYNQAPLIQTA